PAGPGGTPRSIFCTAMPVSATAPEAERGERWRGTACSSRWWDSWASPVSPCCCWRCLRTSSSASKKPGSPSLSWSRVPRTRHEPKTMAVRVTRPAFIAGIKALKAKQGVADYDPNRDETRQEMRSFVCGQCHVEYYFKGPGKIVTYPWANGLKVEDVAD